MMKMKTNKKIAGAAAMLLLSTAMLGTSTYAWFTMNKEVKVTGMQVKAHAEEGLLINEVALASSPTWDEEAIAGDNNEWVALRPASTKDLVTWYHANSKKSHNDAGLTGSGTVDSDTVAITSGTYYSDITSVSVNTRDGSGTAGTAAERNVHYKDAAYGTSGSYDNGEGFYVNYKYYIKSSSSTDMDVPTNNFTVKVVASKDASSSGTSADLDKALRVGVKIDSTYMIFSPLDGDASYYVTGSTAGGSSTKLDSANAAGTRYTKSTDYVVFNTSGALKIPKVTDNGKLVDVYIWFEGEDKNCNSDKLTEVLDDLDINIYFKDTTLD